jgi:hypothetical protein
MRQPKVAGCSTRRTYVWEFGNEGRPPYPRIPAGCPHAALTCMDFVDEGPSGPSMQSRVAHPCGFLSSFTICFLQGWVLDLLATISTLKARKHTVNCDIRIGSQFESPVRSNAIKLHFPRKPRCSFKLRNFLALVSRETRNKTRRQIAQMSTRRHFPHDGGQEFCRWRWARRRSPTHSMKFSIWARYFQESRKNLRASSGEVSGPRKVSKRHLI